MRRVRWGCSGQWPKSSSAAASITSSPARAIWDTMICARTPTFMAFAWPASTKARDCINYPEHFAMRLFLGVDGGQSGTTAVIGDETGRLLGTVEAGPCNHAAIAEARARLVSATRGSLASACAEAGLDPATVAFEAACFGMSGGPEDKREILREILRTPRLLVTN